MIAYATPALTGTSTLPPQSNGSPTFWPFSFTWKRSPSFALPFRHALVTVTVAAVFNVLVMVQLALSPKLARVPEQPALEELV
ncbi:MAG: hypothetical protein E6G03_08445 [Actinobacteria bacterium]|nr:MAG: hypothetical protein E6G03_08445 [Actinomycetota bacterium]